MTSDQATMKQRLVPHILDMVRGRARPIGFWQRSQITALWEAPKKLGIQPLPLHCRHRPKDGDRSAWICCMRSRIAFQSLAIGTAISASHSGQLTASGETAEGPPEGRTCETVVRSVGGVSVAAPFRGVPHRRILKLSAMLVVGWHSPLQWSRMFLVDAAGAAAIRRAVEVDGEPGTLAELRVQFPEVVDDETALLCARMIAGWKPFESGRYAGQCSVSLARQSESARQTADRKAMATDLLLQVRCAVYNGTLGAGFGCRFERMSNADLTLAKAP
jgi:hypothetical protein